jgi:hypothetical protein
MRAGGWSPPSTIRHLRLDALAGGSLKGKRIVSDESAAFVTTGRLTPAQRTGTGTAGFFYRPAISG